jgi:hypothetical protein
MQVARQYRLRRRGERQHRQWGIQEAKRLHKKAGRKALDGWSVTKYFDAEIRKRDEAIR